MEFDDRNLTKAERDKILEVLLSQERVLTLLYDKTFPPRPSSQTLAVGGARGLLGTSLKTGAKSTKGGDEAMRTFNYYGQTRLENLDEHDIVGLEREIDFIIRHSQVGTSPQRLATAQDTNSHFVNINLEQKRTQTAGVGKRQRRMRMANSVK